MDIRDRRVVVTGMGVVSPIGIGVPAFWQSLAAGRSAIGPIRNIDTRDLYITIAAEVRDYDPRATLHSKALLLADRYSQFAATAAAEAMAQAGLRRPLPQPFRAAAIIGSGIGGLVTMEDSYDDLFAKQKKATHPLTLLRSIGSSAAAHVSIEHGIKGPCFGTVSACATASHAIGLGWQMIRGGLIDIAIVGAAEACLTWGALRSWQAMRVLSPDGLRPFAKSRNGTVLAEGAGVLVLEDSGHAEARGAAPLAELAGFGMTSDAGDMVNPSVEGPSVAMRQALDTAGVAPSAVGHINAHGTATTVNDVNETRAIRAVFGNHAERIAINSTKSMHGHCLGAGGGIEAIAAIMALSHGLVPPTVGFDAPGDECDLDYTPNVPRDVALSYAMSNSFAFGGLNAVLLFGAADRL